MEPSRIIFLGDWWDMPSLNRYAPARSSELEGRRVRADIDAGNRAMDKLLDSLTWTPDRMIFCMGNHEERLLRLGKEDSAFEGVFDDAFSLSGLEVVPFLTPATVDGVAYCHYFVNQYTGKPLGGTALSQLKSLGFSFTAGHKQILDIARMDRNNRTTVQGVVAGAFYSHDEGYKGAQGNHHWRGLIHKTDVRDGAYDLQTMRLDSLVRQFGGQ
jgi:hypothetical protein